MTDGMVLAGLTELMSGGEGRGQAVVFDHRAAPLGVAHGANICHAKSVTGGGSTQVLDQTFFALVHVIRLELSKKPAEHVTYRTPVYYNLSLIFYSLGLRFYVL